MDNFNDFYRKVGEKSGVDAAPLVFHDLLAFFKDKISPYDKTLLNTQYELGSLFKDVISKNNDHDIFNSNAPENYWGLAQLCHTIQKLYSIDTINQFTLPNWQEMREAVIHEFNFSKGIGAKFGNNFRLLSKILNAEKIDQDFLLSGITDVARVGKVSQKGLITTFGSLTMHYPAYTPWISSFETFINEKVMKTTKDYSSSLAKLLKFVIETAKISDPLVYFSERRGDFLNWLTDNDHKNKLANCRIGQDFSLWYVNTYLTDFTDEPTALGYPLFDNIRYQYVLKQKNNLGNAGPHESPKNAMPTKFVSLCKYILSGDDYAWPKSLDSERFSRRNPITKAFERVWCPTNAILFLMMLELPVRKIQLTSLDSGEGDVLRYDVEQKIWVENTNANASHWKRLGTKVQSRGVLSQNNANLDKVDLYLNTNKTGDIKEQFTETSGYTIPWHNETVIELVSYLRQWQEEYNPSDMPLSYIDIPSSTFSNSATDAAKLLIPDRFYLFRSYLNSTSSEAPIADFRTFRFWHQLMGELERRLNKQGDKITIVIKRDTKGIPTSSIFTPHGLRVTGLTSFMEAGVPIEILSKIVAGHKSILMTLHYIKFSNVHISEVLNGAQHLIEKNAQSNFAEWLLESSWKDAQKYSVFNDVGSFEASWLNKNAALFENREFGICPTSGTTCDKGGKVVKKSASNGKTHLYEAVSGGAGNCIMCRYFITGRAWLIPLWMKTNVLLREGQAMAQKLDESRQQLESLKKDRFGFVKENNPIPASLKAKIQHFEGLLDKRSLVLDSRLNECHRAYNLLQQVRAKSDVGIDEVNKTENSPALVGGEDDEFLFDETSQFRQLDFIVQGARLYDDLDIELFEKDRDHFIDSFLFNSGMTPITLTPLSDSEKRVATDAVATYLTKKLSDVELDQLEANTVTLEELGYKSSLDKHVAITLESKRNQIPVVILD